MRILTTAAGIIAALCMSSASAQVSQPDFAFPQKVMKDAGAELVKARRAGDAVKVLEYMMQYDVAQASVANDSIPSLCKAMIAEANATRDTQVASLMRLYAATLAHRMFSQDRWRYNRRNDVTPAPSDMKEWSGNRFRFFIDSLVTEAWKGRGDMPTASLKGVIKADAQTLRYYPTQADCMASIIDNDFSFDLKPELQQKVSKDIMAMQKPLSAPWFNLKARELIDTDIDNGSDDKILGHLLELFNTPGAELSDRVIVMQYIYFNFNDDSEQYFSPILKAVAVAEPMVRGTWLENCVTSLKKQIERRRGQLRVDNEIVVADKPFTVYITRKYNVDTLTVKAYRFDSPTAFAKIADSRLSMPKPTASVTVAKADTTATLTLPPGYYRLYLLPQGGEIAQRRQSLGVTSTDYIPMTFDPKGKGQVYVYTAEQGRPAKGVTVSARVRQGKKQVTVSAVTDSHGLAVFTKSISGPITVKDKKASVEFPLWSSSYYRSSNASDIRTATVYTSMPVYMPGDSVNYACVLLDGNGVLAGRTVKVSVSDPDDKEIATATGTTDSFGRFSAGIKLKKDLKNGRYSIMVGSTEKGQSDKDVTGWGSFQVADFKTDAYRLTDVVIQPSMSGAQNATVTGRLVDYSNVGVDGAEVSCAFKSWGETEHTTTASGLTGNAGRFSLSVAYPDSISGGYLISAIKVIAPDGSSLSDDRTFDCRHPLTLNVSALNDTTARYKIGAANTTLPFRFKTLLRDAAGKDMHQALSWRVVDDSQKQLLDGKAACGDNSIDISTLKAGRYSLQVFTDNPVLADTCSYPVVAYNPMIADLPVEQPVWTPLSVLKPAKNSDSAVLQIMARDEGTTVGLFATCTADDGFIALKTLNAGMNNIPVKLGKYGTKGNIQIVCVRDAVTSSITLPFSVKPRQSLRIVVESMRDSVSAGSSQQWSLRVVGDNNKGVHAAISATAFNSRILSIAGYSPLVVQSLRTTYYSSVNFIRSGYGRSVAQLNIPALDLPDFSRLATPAWCYPFDVRKKLMIRGTKNIYGSRSPSVDLAVNEEVAEDSSLEEKEAEAVPGLKVLGYATANDAGAGTTDSEATTPDRTQAPLREGMTRLALWQPGLATDDKGNIAIPVTLPEDNTTWSVYLTAWDSKGNGASLQRNIVASRPLMVSVNTPSFLRRGDRATIIGSVLNNSPKNTKADMTLQVFGSREATDAAISAERTFEMAPGGTYTLDIDLNTLAKGLDADTLYVVARATGEEFADAVRMAIAVESSQCQVTETTNFYLRPGDKSYTTSAPKGSGSDFSCQLTFTQNPMWTVLESLESLKPGDPVTADQAANALFCAYITTGVAKAHPSFASAYNPRQWSRLKDKAVRLLLDLQDADGSVRWGNWSDKGNRWTTASVLSTLAQLQRAGYISLKDSQLADFCARAVSYCDKKINKDDVSFAVWRPAYAWVTESLDAAQSIDATMQYILKDWRGMGIARKAFAATALSLNENPNMARTLMSSVSQFGTDRQGKGLEFSNVSSLYDYAVILRAYGTVIPTSPDIDGIRQYLLVRRQGTVWGNSALTADIVSAMLDSGTKWSVAPQKATISVNGVNMKTDTDRAATGTVSVPLSPGVEVSVTNPGDSPAYGAIVSRYTSEMADVQAYDNDELKVGKILLTRNGNSWVEYGQSGAPAVGSPMRVRITVTAGRPMNNVVITDDRAATMLPVNQLSRRVFADGVSAYLENRNASTVFYFDYLPKGTYVFEYDVTATVAGSFASGIATASCSLAPTLTAHSGGTTVRIAQR